MKNIIVLKGFFTLIFVSLFSIQSLSAEVSYPIDEEDGYTGTLSNPYTYGFSVDDTQKRILVYSDSIPFVDTSPNNRINDWVEKIAKWAEGDWRKYISYGFISPRSIVADDGVEELHILTFPGSGGYTGGAQIIVRQSDLTGNTMKYRFALSHEIFHNIQFASNGNRFFRVFTEGAAQLAPELINLDLDLLADPNRTSDTCDDMYLQHIDKNLWTQSNVCRAVVWWRYFTEQLGTVSNEPERGIDAFVDFYSSLLLPTGWRAKWTDTIVGVGDFDGDFIHDMVLRSNTHIGIVNPTIYDPVTLSVVVNNRRFNNGWKLKQNDRVLGVGNFSGNNRSEIIIKSDTHLGLIGMDENRRFLTITTIENDSRFGGGWKLNSRDRVLGVGNFDSNDRSDFIIRSGSHLGIIGLGEDNSFKTIAAIANDSRFGSGWKLNSRDRVLGVGNFDSNDRSDFIIRSGSHLGIIGLGEDNSFKTIAAIANDSRFGGGWKLNSRDRVLGVGNFDSNDRSDFIIRSGSHLGIIGLGEDNSFKTITTIANDSRFGGGWKLNSRDRVLGVGNFDSNDRSDFIIRSGSHLGIIGLGEDNSFKTIAAIANGSRFGGGWKLNSRDRLLGVGDFDGDGLSEMVLQSNEKLGVVGLNNINQWMTKYSTTYNNQYNNRFDSLLKRINDFVIEKSSGERNLKTFWRDFTIANYAKSLTGSLITSKYRYYDEQQETGPVDFDHDSTTPPVKTERTDQIPAVGTNINHKTNQQPWAAKYYRITPEARTSRIHISIEQDKNIGEVFYTVLIIKSGELLREIKQFNDDLNEIINVPPSSDNEIIVIVTTLSKPLSYSYRIR